MLTVVTPAASARLATLAQVKADLSISGSGEDAALEALLDQASAAIASYCRRVFGLEVLSETIRLTRAAPMLLLARPQVAAITSVIEEARTLDAAEYELDGPSGLVARLVGGRLSIWAAQKIVVAYSAGWVMPASGSPTLPADIQRACMQLVASLYAARGRDLSIRSEGAQDVGQISYMDPRAGMEALPAQVAGLLSPYRLAA